MCCSPERLFYQVNNPLVVLMSTSCISSINLLKEVDAVLIDLTPPFFHQGLYEIKVSAYYPVTMSHPFLEGADLFQESRFFVGLELEVNDGDSSFGL